VVRYIQPQWSLDRGPSTHRISKAPGPGLATRLGSSKGRSDNASCKVSIVKSETWSERFGILTKPLLARARSVSNAGWRDSIGASRRAVNYNQAHRVQLCFSGIRPLGTLRGPIGASDSRLHKHWSPQSIPLAPLEIRDAVFREFIRVSPASNYMEELVTGPEGLLSRGLEDHATSYGALPRTKQERAALAAILNDYVCAKFPEYAQPHERAISPGEVKVHDALYLCASVLKNNHRDTETQRKRGELFKRC